MADKCNEFKLRIYEFFIINNYIIRPILVFIYNISHTKEKTVINSWESIGFNLILVIALPCLELLNKLIE